jgi:SAM-dependent methyltransferase
MRVGELDRDMRDVIPTSLSPHSDFLFSRMTARTLALAAPGPGCRILDVASGLAQDAVALERAGARAVALEPSARMSELARLAAAERREAGDAVAPSPVRGFSDALPFRDACFDAVICKGSLDHFDAPERALAEMARVTRAGGRVVLAVANFESAACRIARAWDAVFERWLGRRLRAGRRHYDVPHDHFTRYDLALLREHAGRFLELEAPAGVSLFWGLRSVDRALAKLPRWLRAALLHALDAVARTLPSLADVVLLCGRPRAAAAALLDTSSS